MATGSHNQQTACTDKQSELWISMLNYYMLPHCLGCSDGTRHMCEHYHDNQNVNLPPITRLCNWEYQLGCNDWSFHIGTWIENVARYKSTNWIIYFAPRHGYILHIVDSMIMNFQNSVKPKQFTQIIILCDTCMLTFSEWGNTTIIHGM